MMEFLGDKIRKMSEITEEKKLDNKENTTSYIKNMTNIASNFISNSNNDSDGYLNLNYLIYKIKNNLIAKKRKTIKNVTSEPKNNINFTNKINQDEKVYNKLSEKQQVYENLNDISLKEFMDNKNKNVGNNNFNNINNNKFKNKFLVNFEEKRFVEALNNRKNQERNNIIKSSSNTKKYDENSLNNFSNINNVKKVKKSYLNFIKGD